MTSPEIEHGRVAECLRNTHVSHEPAMAAEICRYQGGHRKSMICLKETGLAGLTEEAAGSSLWRVFDRAEWSRLRFNTPLSLSGADLDRLSGVVDMLSLDEIAHIYLPLSRLLNLQFQAARSLKAVQDTFLGQPVRKSPFIIGVAGSVAAGKSTFARALRTILSRWPEHPNVDLVTTDGFLYPSRVLEERGLMQRKGFPESYDLRDMTRFLSEVKSGAAEVHAPVYSHVLYDQIAGETQTIRQPDILIFEGLNVLQLSPGASLLTSDFFDFSIYLDADETNIEEWYVSRFLVLKNTAFRDSKSYFHRYCRLTDTEAEKLARTIWKNINHLNLKENIQPSRERARIILHKGADHRVSEVRLRTV
ncbi:type I pantothenate kinase [Acetobacter sp. AN02]|uniref:type I pantothenate kinase n=1 Tax=Acetobacter sp. AN02 TaxID=2894186 RepID=UPI002434623A|nr:type I pantothenate kinase [Acetobacter sp. AN02]MDG6093955.1 type I pantothenate kinase [Acetobacter sp. AN02]